MSPSLLPINRIPPKFLKIVGVLFLAFIALAAYILENYHATLMKERQDKTQMLVDNAYNLIGYYYGKLERDELKEDKAKRYALESIKQLSLDQESYFWVMDTHPRMVMHPIQPLLDGQDLTDYIGPDGKKLFHDMVNIASVHGAGFIHYAWTKPNTNNGELYPKVSYIKLFKPWNWVIGSGVYVDDVDAAFWNAVYVSCGISLAVLMFIIALAMTVSESLKRS